MPFFLPVGRAKGGDQLYEQIYEPVAGSLVLSTVVAAIPILVLFVLLAGLRIAAHWASLITLAVALVTGLLGKEGDLLRLVLKWSIGLTLVMAVWVTLQAYVFKFLIP